MQVSILKPSTSNNLKAKAASQAEQMIIVCIVNTQSETGKTTDRIQ